MPALNRNRRSGAGTAPADKRQEVVVSAEVWAIVTVGIAILVAIAGDSVPPPPPPPNRGVTPARA